MKDHLDLQDFLAKNKIPAEIMEMPGETKTARMAAGVMGIDIDRIVKSVVFISRSGSGVIGIVKGGSKVSHEKIEKITGETINTASPEEVLKLTGYKAGAVPPVGTGLKTIIDSDVMKMDLCYAGGGSEQHLIKISPHAIRKAVNATIADIKK
ncbi:MAG: aminoacyl-tRNA deacylase [Candidatus Aenigmarchaeota archaeon]|nr:aminoacyl-tRNA deacylase [Candidatus Aenigmarchaeota archaeon]